MSYPVIPLTARYVAQKEYSSDTVTILQVQDDVAARRLRVFCQLGEDPSFRSWVVVAEGDDYSHNWDNDDVNAAVIAHFTNEE